MALTNYWLTGPSGKMWTRADKITDVWETPTGQGTLAVRLGTERHEYVNIPDVASTIELLFKILAGAAIDDRPHVIRLTATGVEIDRLGSVEDHRNN